VIDVTHIAKLARIGMKDDELKKMEAELSAILGFVEKLKEVDVENIEPMAGGTSLFNIYREDEAMSKPKEQREKILRNAPKRKNDYVEVLAVFD
jgi:aspartyl-tRNA(Asn)/glutamyl-tRNA(Gln) amidotransferase subunit C